MTKGEAARALRSIGYALDETEAGTWCVIEYECPRRDSHRRYFGQIEAAVAYAEGRMQSGVSCCEGCEWPR